MGTSAGPAPVARGSSMNARGLPRHRAGQRVVRVGGRHRRGGQRIVPRHVRGGCCRLSCGVRCTSGSSSVSAPTTARTRPASTASATSARDHERRKETSRSPLRRTASRTSRTAAHQVHPLPVIESEDDQDDRVGDGHHHDHRDAHRPVPGGMRMGEDPAHQDRAQRHDRGDADERQHAPLHPRGHVSAKACTPGGASGQTAAVNSAGAAVAGPAVSTTDPQRRTRRSRPPAPPRVRFCAGSSPGLPRRAWRGRCCPAPMPRLRWQDGHQQRGQRPAGGRHRLRQPVPGQPGDLQSPVDRHADHPTRATATREAADRSWP